MIKLKKSYALILIFIFANIFSCDEVNQPRKEDLKPITTNSTTPLPIPPKKIYKLFLKVYTGDSCSTQRKLLFSVNENGVFKYLNEIEKLETNNLSKNEISELNNLINKLDIESLAENIEEHDSQNLSSTDNCQEIVFYQFKLNDLIKTFDNSKIYHSIEYFSALELIKNKLEELKLTGQKQIFPYSLPFKITSLNECSFFPPTNTTYLLDENGMLFYLDNSEGENYKRFMLNEEEVTVFKNLLDEVDLVSLKKDDIEKNESSEEKKCRVIETFSLKFKGENVFFDLNGHQYLHSTEYTDALLKLRRKLNEFMRL